MKIFEQSINKMNKLKNLNDIIKSKIVDHAKPLVDAVKDKNMVAKKVTKSDLALLNMIAAANEERKYKYVLDMLYRKVQI